jgi:hypothetical protein
MVVPDPRYFCVSCEQVDYKPKSLEELGIQRVQFRILRI